MSHIGPQSGGPVIHSGRCDSRRGPALRTARNHQPGVHQPGPQLVGLPSPRQLIALARSDQPQQKQKEPVAPGVRISVRPVRNQPTQKFHTHPSCVPLRSGKAEPRRRARAPEGVMTPTYSWGTHTMRRTCAYCGSLAHVRLHRDTATLPESCHVTECTCAEAHLRVHKGTRMCWWLPTVWRRCASLDSVHGTLLLVGWSHVEGVVRWPGVRPRRPTGVPLR